LYRNLAQDDPEILSIHISSGLSGTLSSAQAGAAMAPEANVTFFDTQTLSCPQGWMVQFATKAAHQGWSAEQITKRLEQMRQRTQGLFTLSSLKYLIHGGRISHIKALAASVLNIKPIIGPDKDDGKYITFGQERSLRRTIQRIPDVAAKIFPDLSQLRVQLLHGDNPTAVEMLKDAISQRFTCQFEPTVVIAPVLGAHTGPSVVGLAVGDPKVFEGLD
jgi:DegV family protein with EDD domain